MPGTRASHATPVRHLLVPAFRHACTIPVPKCRHKAGQPGSPLLPSCHLLPRRLVPFQVRCASCGTCCACHVNTSENPLSSSDYAVIQPPHVILMPCLRSIHTMCVQCNMAAVLGFRGLFQIQAHVPSAGKIRLRPQNAGSSCGGHAYFQVCRIRQGQQKSGTSVSPRQVFQHAEAWSAPSPLQPAGSCQWLTVQPRGSG